MGIVYRAEDERLRLLGQALEQKQDTAGACEQYQAIPRAVGRREAEERDGRRGAGARERALGCPGPASGARP
jgi:hypothetical protein